jgi:hypothetical protein
MINSMVGGYGIAVYNGVTVGMNVPGDFSQMKPGTPGELRVLGNMLYVWTNGAWNVASNGTTTVELTPEVQSLIDWARTAKRREEELATLIQKYPSVKSAKDNLDVVVALTRDYSKD